MVVVGVVVFGVGMGGSGFGMVLGIVCFIIYVWSDVVVYGVGLVCEVVGFGFGGVGDVFEYIFFVVYVFSLCYVGI